jgi:hypothetical protein
MAMTNIVACAFGAGCGLGLSWLSVFRELFALVRRSEKSRQSCRVEEPEACAKEQDEHDLVFEVIGQPRIAKACAKDQGRQDFLFEVSGQSRDDCTSKATECLPTLWNSGERALVPGIDRLRGCGK